MVTCFVYYSQLTGMFSSNDLKQLAEESQIMARFDHPNVMRLLGVAISQAHQTLFVVMPFMAQGSLLSYLRKHRTELTVENEEMTDMVRSKLNIDSSYLYSILR